MRGRESPRPGGPPVVSRPHTATMPLAAGQGLLALRGPGEPSAMPGTLPGRRRVAGTGGDQADPGDPPASGTGNRAAPPVRQRTLVRRRSCSALPGVHQHRPVTSAACRIPAEYRCQLTVSVSPPGAGTGDRSCRHTGCTGHSGGSGAPLLSVRAHGPPGPADAPAVDLAAAAFTRPARCLADGSCSPEGQEARR
jgi:hypothetical protein